MFYAHYRVPKQPKKLPWYGRYSNRLLIFFSTIFMILGLGLVAVGTVMMVLIERNALSKDEVKAIFNGMNYNGSLNIGTVLNGLPLLTIIVGGVVFFLGVFQCIARGCKNRICLTMNAILVFWFLIVQILTCAMWVVMRDQFEDTVKGHLETSFEEYEGVHSNVGTSIGWDLIHLSFDCCSLKEIEFTSNRYTFNVTKWWDTRTDTLDLVPTSCCMYATESNYKTTFTDPDCEHTLIAHNKKPCYEEIVSWLKLFWKPAISVAATLIPIEVLIVFLSCVLCCGVRQSRQIKY